MWYYVQNGQRVGPVGEDEVRSLIANGTIQRQTLVWKKGMQNWVQAGTTELAAWFSSTPPVPPAYAAAAPAYPGSPTYAPTSQAAFYDPRSFRTLWLWLVWLVGAGIPLTCIFIGIIPLIAGIVIGYVLLYRFWAVIQDGNARTTPGKAVGFCFIPFFNYYWIYVAYVGLAQDMNAYCDQRNIAGPRASDGLALAWFILALTTIVPYVGIITAIAAFVIWIILYKQFSDTATRICEARTS